MNIDFAYWALQCAAMMITCLLIPKLTVDGPLAALVTVVALSFINAHLWSSALFMQVPNNLTNKALLLFLTNGALFWFVVKILPGIAVEGILPALIAPVVFSVMSLLIDEYKDQIDWAQLWKSILDFFMVLKDYFSKHVESSILPGSNILMTPHTLA